MTNNYDTFNTDLFVSRLEPGLELRSQRPFEPKNVSTGQSGYGYQSNVRIIPKEVDKLRNLTNPKISYTTPLIRGNNTLIHNDKINIENKKIKKTPHIENGIIYNIPTSHIISNKLNENYNISSNSRNLNSNQLLGTIESTNKYYDINTKGSFLNSNKETKNYQSMNINSMQNCNLNFQDELKQTNK